MSTTSPRHNGLVWCSHGFHADLAGWTDVGANHAMRGHTEYAADKALAGTGLLTNSRTHTKGSTASANQSHRSVMGSVGIIQNCRVGFVWAHAISDMLCSALLDLHRKKHRSPICRRSFALLSPASKSSSRFVNVDLRCILTLT